MFYKSLRKLSLVLSLCFFAALITPAIAGSLFTVENVSVDVTADNAINARNQAFEQAQAKAFKVLADRMLSESEAQAYKIPDVSTISTLIKDYEITKEKLSSVRYIGTYTFRFSENGVRRLFGGTGQTYTDVQSKPLLILPFYKKGAQTKLWAPDNSWMQAWARNKNTGSLVPMVVPIGDLNDVSDIGDHQAMTYNDGNLKRMVKRYNAGEAVILIANADSHLSLVDNANQPATGTMSIDIFRTDQGMPEYVEQMTLAAQPDQTLSQFMDKAVTRVQQALKKDWKAKTLASSTQSGSIDVSVPIRTLADWAEIQSKLGKVAGVRNIAVKSLSPREAQVQIEYQGDTRRLTLALDQVDLSLTQETQPGPTPIGYPADPYYVLQKKARGLYRGGTGINPSPFVSPYGVQGNYSQTF